MSLLFPLLHLLFVPGVKGTSGGSRKGAILDRRLWSLGTGISLNDNYLQSTSIPMKIFCRCSSLYFISFSDKEGLERGLSSTGGSG
ncbi:hypothetical protein QBC39DRAFT_337049, partial [Podospora conica]